jgi:hypothetical protein
MFGKIAWPTALYGALAITQEAAVGGGIAWPVPGELNACRNQWKATMEELAGSAGAVAETEYEAKIEPQAKLYRKVDVDADVLMSSFDVFEFFIIGVARIWPHLNREARLHRTMEPRRRSWLRGYAAVLAQGGFLNERTRVVKWPVTIEDVRAADVPWLPASFWWRHMGEALEAGEDSDIWS